MGWAVWMVWAVQKVWVGTGGVAGYGVDGIGSVGCKDGIGSTDGIGGMGSMGAIGGTGSMDAIGGTGSTGSMDAIGGTGSAGTAGDKATALSPEAAQLGLSPPLAGGTWRGFLPPSRAVTRSSVVTRYHRGWGEVTQSCAGSAPRGHVAVGWGAGGSRCVPRPGEPWVRRMSTWTGR